MFDLIVIGAGPAGLTAAIYAARAGLRFVVLEQDGCGGGQIAAAHQVQNYPGLPQVSGADLGETLRRQAVGLGAEIRFAIVTGVKDLGDSKQVLLDGEEPLDCKCVIAATGAVPRTLGIPGEAELAGVSYCAVCDGAFFAGKPVAVIGGGDTAVEDALYLAGICPQVTLILRRAVFRAARTRVELLLRQKNIRVLYNTKPRQILGGGHVEGLVLAGENAGSLAVDAVFIAVGTEPATQYLQGLPLGFENGYVIADETGRTALPGVFAAGDIRRKQLRQVVTAVADGANAATSAAAYLSAL